ncbi:DNA translocase FtsK 4TM domain-containing protein [Psychrosphaera aquimarina]|uniref:DNA translocase FtsK n=1 Tax=Psychrosphaera aquimarina TaxID=2044854 RepID=A0ABU3QWX3_9GAMM|nr:DNA translocase FtsK 4TM domain-containing protein [Psychrosphaera aquimarina]MDU0111918.1 DNA translocase FtsK 4TM domain-containing protein [Psychrosphaera aquimarina]
MLNGFQRLLEAGLFIAGLIAIYILITLFTFDPADPSWSKTGNYELIKNGGGAFGAWLSDILLFTFGWLAFFVPVAVSLVGWLLFRKFHNLIEIDYLALGLRLIGIFLFIIGSSALSSINFDDIYYFSSGGIIGDVIAYLLLPVIGFSGSTLVLLVFVLIGITLMTGVSWIRVVDGLGKYTIAMCSLIYAKLRNAIQNAKDNKQKGIDVAANKVAESEVALELNTAAVEPADEMPAISIPDKLEGNNSQSLLNQFFGAAEIKEQSSNIGSTAPELIDDSKIDLVDSQAAGMVDAQIEPVTKGSNIVKAANQISLDDDMPISFDEYDQQPTYSGVDDELHDDDIKGALDGMQAAHQRAPQRDTNVVENLPPLVKEVKPITLPSLDLLDRPDKVENPVSQEELDAVSRLVEAKLLDFNIQAKVVGVFPGPVITRFELDLAPGIKVSKITTLSKDLARSLSALSVRVVEVIPGKSFIGLELPNKHRQIVRLSEVMNSAGFQNSASPLTMVLGKDIAGKAVTVDLAKMPHLLVAGTTGSGKSVGVNTMILSLLYKSTPEDVRLIMIDPKMLELSVYEGIPHLLSEVVTDMKEAANALRWCVGEMERRYKLMSSLGVRNLKGYNAKVAQAIADGTPILDPLWVKSEQMSDRQPALEKLPAIVVVIDEFADMMMIVGKKVEELIARIAQKARAAGIHLVLATQRPSVDVITGLIKANIPTRMAFQVSSKIDSRTILDQQGAENLLGMGDMLYLPPGSGVPTRVHGAFVDDHEVHAVVKDWKSKAKPNYVPEILQGEMTDENMLPGEAAEMADGEEIDPVFDEAVAFVTETRKVSISSIQRKLRIGYNRSARIVEQMETMGIVSRAANNGGREVLAPPPVKNIEEEF